MFISVLKKLGVHSLPVSVIKNALRFQGLSICKSSAGFLVITSWPHERYAKQAKKIRHWLTFLPSEQWSTDHLLVAGGAYAIGAWPKNDPNYQKYFGTDAESG